MLLKDNRELLLDIFQLGCTIAFRMRFCWELHTNFVQRCVEIVSYIIFVVRLLKPSLKRTFPKSSLLSVLYIVRVREVKVSSEEV